jgi:hypothetical protein
MAIVVPFTRRDPPSQASVLAHRLSAHTCIRIPHQNENDLGVTGIPRLFWFNLEVIGSLGNRIREVLQSFGVLRTPNSLTR